MAKQAKREKKLAERRAKKQAKAENKGIKKEVDKTLPIDHIINLEDLTRPDKK